MNVADYDKCLEKVVYELVAVIGAILALDNLVIETEPEVNE